MRDHGTHTTVLKKVVMVLIATIGWLYLMVLILSEFIVLLGNQATHTTKTNITNLDVGEVEAVGENIRTTLWNTKLYQSARAVKLLTLYMLLHSTRHTYIQTHTHTYIHTYIHIKIHTIHTWYWPKRVLCSG